VVDREGRPLGLATIDTILSGAVLPARVADLTTPATEIAHRLATGVDEPHHPVIAVDRSGRYVGIVTLRRLLSHVANRADAGVTTSI